MSRELSANIRNGYSPISEPDRCSDRRFFWILTLGVPYPLEYRQGPDQPSGISPCGGAEASLISIVWANSSHHLRRISLGNWEM